MRSARPIVAVFLALLTLLAAGMLPARSASAASGTFSNTNAISINDNTTATPYPSTVTVSGLGVSTSVVTLVLYGLDHDEPDEINMMLVGPGGQRFVFLANAAEGDGADPNGANIGFADGFPQLTSFVAGTYAPTANELATFPGQPNGSYPAPVGTSSFASVFNGTNPNGIWSLYITDDFDVDAGAVTGGWALSIATAVTPTLTTLAVNPNPSTYGQASYTFTSTVTPTSGGGTPTGSVQFLVDNVVVGSSPLVGNTATFTYTPGAPLSVGTHTAQAYYPGDVNYAASGSPIVNLVVNAIATTTTVTAAPNPAPYGTSPFTFTATVTSPNGTPTGVVGFYVDAFTQAAQVGVVNLVNGVATYSYAPATPLSVGNHTIYAYYPGDNAGYAASLGQTTLTINQATTNTTAVAVNPVTVVYGQNNATLSATVSNNSNGAPLTAGGTLTFNVPGVCSPASVAVPAGPSPQTVTATCSLPASVAPGNYTITATYSGNAQFAGSSGTGPLTIVKANTSTTIAPTSYNTTCADPTFLVVTATVTNTSNNQNFKFSTDSLTFTLKSGATTLGTYPGTRNPADGAANPVTFTAAIPVSALQNGAYTVDAAYSGSDKFNASATATPTTINITSATTSTSVSDTTVEYGATSATLNATVLAGNGGVVNGGTVTFTVKKGAQIIGTTTAPVVNNAAQATYPLNGLGAGNYTISAVYSGTTTCYSGSQSNVETNGTLKVTKRILWVQPKDQSRAANKANPGCKTLADIKVYTPVPAGTGLVNGDTLESAVTLAQSFNCTYGAVDGTNARPTKTGTYNISAGGLLSANYEIRYKIGTLTVTPAVP